MGLVTGEFDTFEHAVRDEAEHVEQRGLTGAVRPNEAGEPWQGDPFAILNLPDREVLERLEVPDSKPRSFDMPSLSQETGKLLCVIPAKLV